MSDITEPEWFDDCPAIARLHIRAAHAEIERLRVLVKRLAIADVTPFRYTDGRWLCAYCGAEHFIPLAVHRADCPWLQAQKEHP